MGDKNRIRLRLEPTIGGDIGFPILNFFTGRIPVIPRARDIQMEIVVLDNGNLDQSMANCTSIVVEVRKFAAQTDAPLISVAAGSFNASLTADQDTAATSQHALAVLPASQTGLDMTGADSNNNKDFWLVITATRSGNLVTLGAGRLVCHNDAGQYSGNTPTAGDPGYYTKAEVNGLMANFIADFFATPGRHLYLRNNVGNQLDFYLDDNNVPQMPVGPAP